MFGLSLHGWENWMVGSLIIAAAFALIAGFATWAVVRLQRIEIAASKDEFNKFKVESDVKLAEANARALEAKVELEKFKADRKLTPEQQAIVADKVRRFQGIKFDTGLASTDPEYIVLLNAIEAALKSAGWIPIEWHGPGLTVNRAPSLPAGLVSVAGVAIFTQPAASAELWEAATALVSVLNEKEVGIEADAGRMTVSGNTNADAIHVMVGRKR
jgi:hypothetical protein